MELDDDFQVDVGVELDGLALPGEVKLDFLYIKIELKQSISWAALFGLDLELDFIVKNPINRVVNRHRAQLHQDLQCENRHRPPNRARLQKTAL